ncbi:MAG: hypothetical protein NWF14_01900 [Candidatus Bathyarchaeota archaeon]|nr:hypothetical protein [Candidatus Bathyarchaeota archaeon]
MGNRKSGLALIGVAFFINAVPSVVNMALGGPYLTLRLIEQGYTIAEIGMLNFQLFLVNSAFEIIFAIIAMAGLVKLSRQS